MIKLYLCVLMENENLLSGLHWVIEPFLVGVVGEETIEGVEVHEEEINMNVMSNLILFLESSPVHHHQRPVTNLLRRQRLPQSKHNPVLHFRGIKFSNKMTCFVLLRVGGIPRKFQVFIKLLSFFIVLIKVEMRNWSSENISLIDWDEWIIVSYGGWSSGLVPPLTTLFSHIIF